MTRHNVFSSSEVEFANFQRQKLRVVTAEQKRQILQLARDFPRLLDCSDNGSARSQANAPHP